MVSNTNIIVTIKTILFFVYPSVSFVFTNTSLSATNIPISANNIPIYVRYGTYRYRRSSSISGHIVAYVPIHVPSEESSRFTHCMIKVRLLITVSVGITIIELANPIKDKITKEIENNNGLIYYLQIIKIYKLISM